MISRYGLHPSLVKPPRAKSRHQVLMWDFLNARTISSARHKNPKRALENNLKLGLTDVVRQVRQTVTVFDVYLFSDCVCLSRLFSAPCRQHVLVKHMKQK